MEVCYNSTEGVFEKVSSISTVQSPGLAFLTTAKPDAVTTQGTATNTQSQTPTAPIAATYPSPTFQIDAISGKTIIDYRDTANGNVTQQIPPLSVARLYQNSANVDNGGASSQSSAV